jgi:hypothetical protein
MESGVSCNMTINRWLIGTIATICNRCGVRFKIDDDSVNYETDTINAIVAAESEEDYVNVAQDLHNELGLDLA